MAVGVSLILLSGCGGEAETPSFDAGQAKAVLPDAKALPDWDVWQEPVAYSLKTALCRGMARCYGDEPDSESASPLGAGRGGLLTQVRVGSVILLSMAEAGARVDAPDSNLRRFAGVFVQRAVEAQDGKTPSAGLAGA